MMDGCLIFACAGWIFWYSMYLWTRRKLWKANKEHMETFQQYLSLLEKYNDMMRGKALKQPAHAEKEAR